VKLLRVKTDVPYQTSSLELEIELELVLGFNSPWKTFVRCFSLELKTVPSRFSAKGHASKEIALVAMDALQMGLSI
jgi:hypothetical protein